MKLQQFRNERDGDLTMIKTAQNMYVNEERARVTKLYNER